MANTITNFLIGLGLDSTEFDKGQRNVTSGLDSLRSKALQLGALAGGAFGVKALTFGFAEAKDNIGKFSEVFSTLPGNIQAIGAALAQEGGTLDSFMGQIAAIERLRASTPQQIGALFAEAGIRGIDPSVILNANSATEAYRNLADVFERLTPKQRLAAAPVFALDEASIRLLSKGRSELDAIVERQRQIRPLTEEMTKAAAEFNRQWKDVKNNVGAVADEISLKLTPVMTGLFSSGNEFFKLLREGYSFSDIVNETFAGGKLSAESTFGKGAAWMDKPLTDVTGRGGELSASNLFGDNAVTRFIDTPLSELITGKPYVEESPYISAMRDLQPVDMRIPAPAPYLPYYLQQQQAQQSNPSPSIKQSKRDNQRPIEVNLMLDGAVIDRRIIDITTQQDEDAYNDITSSTRG